MTTINLILTSSQLIPRNRFSFKTGRCEFFLISDHYRTSNQALQRGRLYRYKGHINTLIINKKYARKRWAMKDGKATTAPDVHSNYKASAKVLHWCYPIRVLCFYIYNEKYNILVPAFNFTL